MMCDMSTDCYVNILRSSRPEYIFPHIWHRFCLLDGSNLGLIHNPSQSKYDESMSWFYSSLSCAVWCFAALFTSTANGTFFLRSTFYPWVILVTIVMFKFQMMLLSLWLPDFPRRSRKWHFNPALLLDDKSENRVYEEGDNLFLSSETSHLVI